jgi:hypothetical protein
MRRALSSNDSDVCPLRFLFHIRAGAGVVAAPQGGKSNPHTRDAGARAWRATETPLRFRRPLVRRRRRPLSLTLSPLPLVAPPFGIAGGPVGAGAGAGGGGSGASNVSVAASPARDGE